MQQSDVAARDRARSHTGNRASRRRHSRLTRVALAATASALASASFAGPALANAQVPKVTSYDYSTVVNQQDPTFNQLLGINNFGQIAGYFGSGAQGHPNQGYLTSMPGAANNRFLGEDAPGSVQTQVTGLNDLGVTVGFWSDQNNASQINPNYGFYSIDGRILTVDFPTMDNANPPVNQLLGVNDQDIAAGFYTDANGNNHGYTYNINTRQFRQVRILGTTSVTAAAINNGNDIAGFMTTKDGTVEGYLLTHDGQFQARCTASRGPRRMASRRSATRTGRARRPSTASTTRARSSASTPTPTATSTGCSQRHSAELEQPQRGLAGQDGREYFSRRG